MKLRLKCELAENAKIVCPKSDNPNSWRVFAYEGFGSVDGDSLLLDPIEAAFLLERDRLQLLSESRIIRFNDFLSSFLKDRLHNFLVYRDLRLRGYKVKIVSGLPYEFEVYESFEAEKPFSAVIVVRAAEAISLDILSKAVEVAKKENLRLLVAIIDELGDLTYYEVKEELAKEARLKIR